ncbi:MAG: rhodanese-like domain-containing protein [Deltaproteobacteria bacterium]|nr:rhodanese-like domain-containing protein [Deltaproteobacteria bacterium]
MRRLWLIPGLLGILIWCSELAADPSRYLQFAQQHLPKGVAPDFISLDRLVDEIVQGKKPMIIDVRSREEYEQSHIKGSIPIPLGEIPLHLAEIPRDKLVVLY